MFIRPERVLRSWFCRFCDPVASPPLTWASVMSLFRLSICCSRVLIWLTSPPTWLSTLVESALIWALIWPAVLRKLLAVVRAWLFNRVDDGLFAALAKAVEMLSGWLKK